MVDALKRDFCMDNLHFTLRCRVNYAYGVNEFSFWLQPKIHNWLFFDHKWRFSFKNVKKDFYCPPPTPPLGTRGGTVFFSIESYTYILCPPCPILSRVESLGFKIVIYPISFRGGMGQPTNMQNMFVNA